jgi:hypothetical protein
MGQRKAALRQSFRGWAGELDCVIAGGVEAKGKKPRPPEARSLRWIPEALEVSGLTHRQ